MSDQVPKQGETGQIRKQICHTDAQTLEMHKCVNIKHKWKETIVIILVGMAATDLNINFNLK